MTDAHLTDDFPPLAAAGDDGLLAVGGDLSAARLLAAYRRGIFPWYGAGQPILWWSPDPRCVIFPREFAPSRGVKKHLRRGGFDFTLDADFNRVMDECAAPRRHDSGGTWITAGMKRAYANLHRDGVAHSAEVWRDGDLAGGLYGVAIGGVFFGESMFSRATDASKVALALLIEELLRWDFRLLDCQVSSPHLFTLGAVEIPRADFIAHLQTALTLPGKPGNWSSPSPPPAPSPPPTPSPATVPLTP